MLTLISVCSYLYYAHRDSILNFVGLSNKEDPNESQQNRGSTRTNKRRVKGKKSVKGDLRSFSDSDMRRKKFILRTYSDVDFHIKLQSKKGKNN
ncbi:hypothetical protein C922_00451 [Plasmodium inui San Antonio 1]|uniref:Uncharacterized protein n=1 Tax=Plasmodium inui San Antonio 1 TaxID=1237626 RepID=W7ABS1_9APIC|nr:hypothetical protein C922_00451 [Plasmodium inui San Antonio 1]EUD68763.1 hypothetical protein C922_00451 [Plasmodium inui San Antonio 1]